MYGIRQLSKIVVLIDTWWNVNNVLNILWLKIIEF